MDLLMTTNSLEEFKTVLTKCLDDLIYLQKANACATLEKVPVTEKTNIEDFLIEFDFDCEMIDLELTKKGWERSRIDYFLQEVARRKTQLMICCIAKYNSVYGKTFINFNWNLKYIFGTSALKQIKYPVVQLIFNTVESKNINKISIYEFDKSVLLKIIQALETIE